MEARGGLGAKNTERPGISASPRFEVLLSFVSGKLLGPVWFLFSWGCAGFRSSSLGFFSMMFVCGKDLNAGRVHFLVASGAFGCGSWDFAAVGESWDLSNVGVVWWVCCFRKE